jgi:phage FluMu gp28-like protein
VLDDLRGIKVFKGIARPPEASIKGKDGQRHCDSAVALALALYACNSIEAGEEWACATAGGGMARRMTHGY